MKKLIIIFIAALFFNLQVCAQNELEKITPDEKLELMVPGGFSQVSREPVWTIAWDEKRVQLYRTRTAQTVDDNGIPAYTDQLIAEVKSKSRKFKLLDDGILLQDGKNVGYIKFLSELNGQKTFHFMFYISMDDKPVLFSFTAPKKQRKKWETSAEAIAASLRIRN